MSKPFWYESIVNAKDYFTVVVMAEDMEGMLDQEFMEATEDMRDQEVMEATEDMRDQEVMEHTEDTLNQEVMEDSAADMHYPVHMVEMATLGRVVILDDTHVFEKSSTVSHILMILYYCKY
ncbi:hypothetical protein AB6A40_007705 [Gnathostoma spinigerum]|uniref:Uncharacterized protein n=1 Tax=Gnathostoma spinigerum TaxID=75299 RepID=A0ABD6EU68_9BILA